MMSLDRVYIPGILPNSVFQMRVNTDKKSDVTFLLFEAYFHPPEAQISTLCPEIVWWRSITVTFSTHRYAGHRPGNPVSKIPIGNNSKNFNPVSPILGSELVPDSREENTTCILSYL